MSWEPERKTYWQQHMQPENYSGIIIEWYPLTRKVIMPCEDCEYPIRLSFTCPETDVEFTRVINDDGEAEDVFHWFFSNWGWEVPYSVDDVEVPAAEILTACKQEEAVV
tara:strand:+ start:357 stop:683 length:327 start_codon:yes stop_codon:yes gene_type:complete